MFPGETVGKAGEFGYLLCSLPADTTRLRSGSWGLRYRAVVCRQVTRGSEDREHEARPSLAVFFLSFAPERVRWSHPVNGLQSILEACRAAAGFPEWRSHSRPECIGCSGTGSRLVVPLQMITEDNQPDRPPKRA